jgi:hypothetical protein
MYAENSVEDAQASLQQRVHLNRFPYCTEHIVKVFTTIGLWGRLAEYQLNRFPYCTEHIVKVFTTIGLWGRLAEYQKCGQYIFSAGKDWNIEFPLVICRRSFHKSKK